MGHPALLIVTGHPATGKTTIARCLAKSLHLPLIAKDLLKETLFDSLGWQDRAWSQEIGVAALSLLYQMADTILAAGMPLIVESIFRPELDLARMHDLARRRPFTPVQLLCVASGEVMAQRYVARLGGGQRHPGHCETLDPAVLEGLRSLGPAEPLPLGGSLRIVDTSDPAKLDLDGLVDWAYACLVQAHER